jgi:hypothetical protein
MSWQTKSVLGILAMTLSLSGAFAADEPKTSEEPKTSSAPEKLITLSKDYREVGEVVAEVYKADSKGLTIRVTWYTPSTNGRNNFGNWGRGSMSRNPQQMYQHMMQMQQQMLRQAIRMANTKPQEHHQDYTFPYTEDAHARAKHLPPKLDDKGKKVPYTNEELREAKGNIALSGFERSLDSVQVGSVVEIHLGKKVGAAKEKKDDLFVRWVYILDESNVKAKKVDQTPAKTPGSK